MHIDRDNDKRKHKKQKVTIWLQVYQFCVGFGWEYLSFRIWIGLWLATMLIILVATDARCEELETV